MKLIKKISNLFLPLIASGALVNLAIASEGSLGKPMKVFRFKTPQMVSYVNSTVSLLKSEENPNKRHLKNLLTCQEIFSTGKKSVRGMEIKILKACKSYKDAGFYQTNLKAELKSLKQLLKSKNENQNSNKGEYNQTEIENINGYKTVLKNVNNQSEAQKKLDQIQASLNMYEAISKVVKRQRPDVKSRFLIAIKKEVKKLNAEKQSLQQEYLNQYSTPITPTNQKLNISSFKASETFPKVPFYVPGTNEIGEMITIPRVTDEGKLVYRLNHCSNSHT